MSVTMAKADGVTVFTLTSDPNSACPPLCQILKGLCYSPVCCSVSQPLRRLQGTSQSVLGTLHIMVGILNVGLGAILATARGYWEDLAFPYWLGALFIFFGVMCILSEKFPSPALVITNVILNLAGVGFSIAALILYGITLDVIRWWWTWWTCRPHESEYWYDSDVPPLSSVSPEQLIIIEKCEEGRKLALMMVRSVDIVLVILSVMELCITISAVVLGIKALMKRGKGENKDTEDPDNYKALQDSTTYPVV
ncbi:uncharacterized protein LOC115435638 [Sphaeramia orbicularis]|uniref:Membrane-spanning 4-domains subfamily A member 15-like n=1 Tax=Sphaeramia orbicularis TaxID=375764 RepID=A0A673A2S2_9TELE|nr:uncharacterized protein LOC115435638 [Sphaeramia orbicularis]